MNPAIGLLEFDSVAAGIAAADAMVKRAPIGDLVTGSVQPGQQKLSSPAIRPIGAPTHTRLRTASSTAAAIMA